MNGVHLGKFPDAGAVGIMADGAQGAVGETTGLCGRGLGCLYGFFCGLVKHNMAVVKNTCQADVLRVMREGHLLGRPRQTAPTCQWLLPQNAPRYPPCWQVNVSMGGGAANRPVQSEGAGMNPGKGDVSTSLDMTREAATGLGQRPSEVMRCWPSKCLFHCFLKASVLCDSPDTLISFIIHEGIVEHEINCDKGSEAVSLRIDFVRTRLNTLVRFSQLGISVVVVGFSFGGEVSVSPNAVWLKESMVFEIISHKQEVIMMGEYCPCSNYHSCIFVHQSY